jgi:HD superfamily phosphodiesterase
LPKLAAADAKPHQTSFFSPPTPSEPTPLTPIVVKVIQLIRNSLAPTADNHSYRTWLWGLLFADYVGWTKEKDWNAELWYITALLHDLGCSEEYHSKMSFELVGGIKAREYLLQWGADEADADEVCEAIVRHTVRHLSND